MASQEIIREFAKSAAAMRVETAALLAVADVETGLKANATVDGRPEPLIRFEGHYFDRRLTGQARAAARAAGLSSPTAGAVRNPASQPARWALLRRAAAIDSKAAYESVSWGLGQVMGAHWAWLGYGSVDAFVSDARSGVAGQLALMCRFIDKAGLTQALRLRDWAGFARGYNGPGFAANRYDSKLAAAYRRHAANTPAGLPADPARGARGAEVRELQERLTGRGARIAVDGIFGPATEAALRDFQRQSGLEPNGIACRETRRRLADTGRSRPAGGFVARLLRILGF